MVAAAALMRILPHPWNFSPIAAIALFGGAHFRTRAAAFGVPLAALALSDLLLGYYPTLPVTYVAFAIVVLIGTGLRNASGWRPVALATVGSSLLFFVVSNLGVWLWEGMYPMTFQGLLACYTAALPFYQGTLLGDLFYTTTLFGLYHLAERRIPALQRASSI